MTDPAAMLFTAMDPTQQKREAARIDSNTYQRDAELRLGYQHEFAQNALKSLVLANGGAIVALFTLLGNLDKAKLAVDTGLIWWAFVAFAAGLICTFVGFFCAFFSQAHYMHGSQLEAWERQAEMLGSEGKFDFAKPNSKGKAWESWGIVSVSIALASFAGGSAFALASVLP